MSKTIDQFTEQMLTRRQVADRWACSNETIKRRTRMGLLKPIRFNTRNVRYPLSQILAVEAAAGGLN